MPKILSLQVFLNLKESLNTYPLVVERRHGLLSISNPIRLRNTSNPFVLIWQGAILYFEL
jgi:hypothetical protein